jgi:aminoacrylate hydrolase
VVVLSAGLGGSGSYWLPQRAALEEQYQVVSYDQRDRGITPARCRPTTAWRRWPELFSALQAAGIARFALVGHALGR